MIRRIRVSKHANPEENDNTIIFAKKEKSDGMVKGVYYVYPNFEKLEKKEIIEDITKDFILISKGQKPAKEKGKFKMDFVFHELSDDERKLFNKLETSTVIASDKVISTFKITPPEEPSKKGRIRNLFKRKNK